MSQGGRFIGFLLFSLNCLCVTRNKTNIFSEKLVIADGVVIAVVSPGFEFLDVVAGNLEM